MVNIWDIATGQKVYSLAGHSEPVLSVSFSRDGKMLASAGQDKKIILWDTLRGREIFKSSISFILLIHYASALTDDTCNRM
jgi:WD40 repeat protein